MFVRMKNMKAKAKVKIIIDFLMTAGLLFLMGFQLWGNVAHEWVGAFMLILFVAHHILNGNWYKNIGKGRYTPIRVFWLVINVLVFTAMLAVMYSGIVMSRHVFVFLPLKGGMAFARRLHILGSYWSFLLMSLHLGLHWSMFAGIAGKMGRWGNKPGRMKYFCFFAGLLIAVYGVVVFIRRDIVSNLLLRNEFVFLDFEESALHLYLDYLAMTGTFVFVSHYISKVLRALNSKGGVD